MPVKKSPANLAIAGSAISRLHGKGSMSEVLQIERQRLMQQAAEEMRVQLGGALPNPALPNPQPVPFKPLEAKPPEANAAAAPAQRGGMDNPRGVVDHRPLETRPLETLVKPRPPRRRPPQDGVSGSSRFVSEDLSEFEGILIHSERTIAKGAEKPLDPYYVSVVAGLPFAAQQRLLGALCRLTLNWGAFSCRITLDLLSIATGIRNFKTLRRWLADLEEKHHVRYIPIHGDLRGSVIELTPPEELRGSILRRAEQSKPSRSGF